MTFPIENLASVGLQQPVGYDKFCSCQSGFLSLLFSFTAFCLSRHVPLTHYFTQQCLERATANVIPLTTHHWVFQVLLWLPDSLLFLLTQIIAYCFHSTSCISHPALKWLVFLSNTTRFPLLCHTHHAEWWPHLIFFFLLIHQIIIILKNH